jgi:hypothetical protein
MFYMKDHPKFVNSSVYLSGDASWKVEDEVGVVVLLCMCESEDSFLCWCFTFHSKSKPTLQKQATAKNTVPVVITYVASCPVTMFEFLW